MLTINLFDANFGHVDYSTAFQTTHKMKWVRGKMQWDGITVFTDAFITSDFVQKVQCPQKIGWLHEPQELHPGNYAAAVRPEIYNQFEYILTYYEPLLQHPSGKFKKVIYGGVWIPENEWGMREKTKHVSMLFGNKLTSSGHKLRWQIWEKLGDKFGIDYYGAKGTPVNYSWETKLQVLKDYRFSIVCETSRQPGLFTEILCDCLAVGTVPLFWGDPDIAEHFDGLGILSFENVYQLEDLLRELDEYSHLYLAGFARENLRRVRDYRITEEWLVEHYFKEAVL